MRSLDTNTLEGAARHLAMNWMREDSVKSPSGKLYIAGPKYVTQELYKFDFKDEFEHILNGVKEWLGGKALAEFEKAAKEVFSPRDDAVFAKLLKEKLAIDPNGKHIEGAKGTVQFGNRWIGTVGKVIKTRRFGEVRVVRNEYWPVYAGELEERAIGSRIVDELPKGAQPDDEVRAVMEGAIIHYATNPNISAEVALLALDAIVDQLDEGTTAANIRGRTGTQPADPDATETGTLLFTLTMSDPAFGAAADNSGSALATAAAITDDSSADATNTLTYCRVAATGTGADDHIDGSAGTSSADFIFNTVSIVSGATVSMSSFTVSLTQGATAT